MGIRAARRLVTRVASSWASRRSSTPSYSVAFLAAIVALGAVWRVVGAGGLQRLSEGCASHAIEGVAAAGGMHDIVLF